MNLNDKLQVDLCTSAGLLAAASLHPDGTSMQEGWRETGHTPPCVSVPAEDGSKTLVRPFTGMGDGTPAWCPCARAQFGTSYELTSGIKELNPYCT